MYSQTMDAAPEEEQQTSRSAADLQQQALLEDRFEARIAEGGFIEAKDWMPEH